MANSKTDSKSTAAAAAPKKTAGKRGAPKGVKRGPRQLFYIVQGIKDGNPFMDQIPAASGADAQAKFEEIHRTKAVGNALGAFYEQKGKGASKSAVSIDINSLKFTGLSKVGEHRGWKCRVLLTEDPATGFVMYTDPIDPNEVKSKRSKPQARAIPMREITNLADV